jgi:hypothetical protein
MRASLVLASGLAVIAIVTGCESIPPGAERGPDGTMAYNVLVEASDPGVRIEANGEYVGNTPVTIKIFGDPDGTFHDFGSYYYMVQAFPARTNQFVQTRGFRTGHLFAGEDYIPRRIYFDMNQPPNYGPPQYGEPRPGYYGPPGYYYYGPGVYFGPPVLRFGFHGHW